MTSVANGHRSTIQRLLDLGADHSTADDKGFTPLHYAVRNSMESLWVPIVAVLLHFGATVNAVDAQLRSPLHWASYIGNFEVVKLLLHYGADVTLKDISGHTPVSLATRPDILEMLQSAVLEASERQFQDWIDNQEVEVETQRSLRP